MLALQLDYVYLRLSSIFFSGKRLLYEQFYAEQIDVKRNIKSNVNKSKYSHNSKHFTVVKCSSCCLRQLCWKLRYVLLDYVLLHWIIVVKCGTFELCRFKVRNTKFTRRNNLSCVGSSTCNRRLRQQR